jgi:hypothetical protein
MIAIDGVLAKSSARSSDGRVQCNMVDNFPTSEQI